MKTEQLAKLIYKQVDKIDCEDCMFCMEDDNGRIYCAIDQMSCCDYDEESDSYGDCDCNCSLNDIVDVLNNLEKDNQ